MLIHGDCIEEMQKLIDKGIRVDAVITDPPYKITSRGSSGNTGGILKTKLSKKGMIFKYNNLNQKHYLNKLFKILKKDTHAYLFTNNKNLKSLLFDIEDTGFKVYKTLIWCKNNCITNMYYMDSHEYIVFFRKGKAKKINNCGSKSTLFFNTVKNRQHPTEKPIKLLEHLIINSTKEGNTVLDFTMGSGTTGVACKNLNRSFIGIELDEKYFNIAKERLDFNDND